MTYAAGNLIQATDYNQIVGSDTTDYRHLHMAAIGCSVAQGGVCTKTGGTNGAWASQVYSYHGYVKSAYVAAKYGAGSTMFGLTSDPAANDSYNTIDYAWYFTNGGAMQIYENGAHIGTYAAVNANSIYSIDYDGATVRYYIDGVEQRAVARAEGAALNFDSSFVTIGDWFTLLHFGPTSDPSTEVYYYTPANGGIVGTTMYKASGTASNWDTGFQSLLSYSNKAFTSATSKMLGNYAMFGLNQTPAEPHVYSNIDYAWYFEGGSNACMIYENGTSVSSHGTYTLATVLSIYYDGVNVNYYKDGVLARSVARAYNGVGLYFDSSFYNVGNGIASVIYMQKPSIGLQWGNGAGLNGVGQSTTSIAAVTAGNTATAAQWTGAIQTINSCLAHQGITQITPTSVTAGSLISYYNEINRGSAMAAAYTGQTGLARTNGAANASSTTIGWGTTGSRLLQFQQHFAFASEQARRNFFNAGGTFQITMARSGGSATTRNTNWTNLLTACGTIGFGHRNAFKTGGSGTPSYLANNGNGGQLSGRRGNWTLQFQQYDTAANYTNQYVVMYTLIDRHIVNVLVQLFNSHPNAFQQGVDGTTSCTTTLGYPATTYLTNTWGTPTYTVETPVTY